MTKMISALTAAAVFAVYATAFAQAPGSDSAPGQMPTQEMTLPSSAQTPTSEPAMGGERKPEKTMKEGQGKGKAKGHAKKTGKKRGLDRANKAHVN